ncbi:MAG: adenylate kinase [Chloroflexota bacterium]
MVTDAPPPLGQRIHVISTSGAGKTTTASQLAEILGYQHIEIDQLHWRPKWEKPPLQEFREKVSSALNGNAWVIDGNYGKVRDIIWRRADTIVWLNYSLAIILMQLIPRTIRRIISREELWAGNREDFKTSFLSKESIILWALGSYKRHKKEYPRLFALTENQHLRIIYLHNRREKEAFLSDLAQRENT